MAGKSPHFVAETNERGSVVWVWRHDPFCRSAHPIRNPSRHLPDTQKRETSFSGAPPEAIIEWLQMRAGQ